MPASRRVSYFFDGEVPHFYYGPGHPMKPHRLKLTHHLLLASGLFRRAANARARARARARAPLRAASTRRPPAPSLALARA